LFRGQEALRRTGGEASLQDRAAEPRTFDHIDSAEHGRSIGKGWRLERIGHFEAELGKVRLQQVRAPPRRPIRKELGYARGLQRLLDRKMRRCLRREEEAVAGGIAELESREETIHPLMIGQGRGAQGRPRAHSPKTRLKIVSMCLK
jgi:hypothetical protein